MNWGHFDTRLGCKMSLFFIHGGPGFNSAPEENLLKNEFAKLDPNIFFWNEPSQKRTASSSVEFKETISNFENYFEQHAEKVNIIVAHSFGAFTALNLSQKILDKVSSFILISPTLNLRKLDENIVSIATRELEKIGNKEKLLELNEQKEKFTDRYDLHRFNTTLNALVSVDLLSFYWFDKKNMATYQSYFQGKNEFDIENFKNIRLSIKEEKISKKINVPATIILGEYDPIAKKEDLKEIVSNYFSNVSLIEMKGTAHYPHIEDSNSFFNFLLKIFKA